MKEQNVLKIKEFIDDMYNTVIESPNPDSLLCDDHRGNEFEQEYRNLLRKLKTALEQFAGK